MNRQEMVNAVASFAAAGLDAPIEEVAEHTGIDISTPARAERFGSAVEIVRQRLYRMGSQA